MTKLRVECTAVVVIDVNVTAKQLRQLDDGKIELHDIIDESVPYRALCVDGEIEFALAEWDRERPKRVKSSKRSKTRSRS